MSYLPRDNKLTWNLEKILDGEDLEVLTQKYFEMLESLTNIYSQGIFSSKETLLKWHIQFINWTKLSNRLYNYLNCKFHEDLQNNYWFTELQRLKTNSAIYTQKLSDFDEQAFKNKELIKEHLRDERLKDLTRFYELIFRNHKHEYPSEVKKVMASFCSIDDSYEQIFSILKDTELPTRRFKDSEKKPYTISNREEFAKTQQHKDRTLRKNAYYSWYLALNAVQETLAKIMYYQILKQNINAKNKGFSGFYEEKMFQDELPTTFAQTLYKRVLKFNTLYKKFKKIQKQKIKKIYKISGLKPWDLQMPVLKSDNSEISIKKAQEMALEALAVLGNEYQQTVQRAFDEGWIDWEMRKNKLTGGYCIGNCFGVESKYILINYDYKLEGVYTLVHELGHAVHAVEFCKNQSIYANTTIFLAEIPSTLNEILLSLHLIDKYEDSPQKQFEIYDNLLEGFFSTTINQVIFSDWEYEANRLVSQGRVLNADTAKLIFKAKREKYYGSRIRKEISSWKALALVNILTIPHFYSEDFYVYKYAVGQVVSVMLAIEIYYKKTPGFIDKYFEFLRSGTSISNLEALKLLGINLEKPEIWHQVKEIVGTWIEKYIELSQLI